MAHMGEIVQEGMDIPDGNAEASLAAKGEIVPEGPAAIPDGNAEAV